MKRAALAPTTMALLAALALSGCETTAEKSAKLEQAAKGATLAAQHGLSIAHPSKLVHVLGVSVVHGGEGAAAVITLHNSSAHALSDVPIAVSVKDGHGGTIYTNATPGLAKTLTSLALLPAHSDGVWIDDQIPSSAARSATATVGEGTVASGALPQLAVQEAALGNDPSGSATAEGTITNRSKTSQSELVIYVLARKDGQLIAAGRAVLASLEPGAATPFQAFLVGAAKDAQLQVSAPPTKLG